MIVIVMMVSDYSDLQSMGDVLADAHQEMTGVPILRPSRSVFVLHCSFAIRRFCV